MRLASLLRFSLLLAVVAAGAFAQPVPAAAPRTCVLLDQSWRFKLGGDTAIPKAESPRFDDSAWQTVTVPHTWSAPGPNGNPTSANGWYRTVFTAAKKPGGERVYLLFEGAATILDVHVNGRLLGQHRGAFTAAVFDVTDALADNGKNLLAVRVSNDKKECADCLPSTQEGSIQLYNPYGGLYRKVWLVTTPAMHIFPELASRGVFIRQDKITAERADLSVRTAVLAPAAASLIVRHLVRDAAGITVATFEGKVATEAGKPVSATVTGSVPNPRLWSPKTPVLYTVETQLLDGARILDSVTETTGFRSIKFDADGHFILNGERILLRGIAKHQEGEHELSALSDDDLREDWRGLQDLGVNYVRLAHYPHAKLEYDLADQAGILVWAENGHSNKNVRTPTGDLITREMVRQNFNHPGIVIWSCGNETFEEEAASAYAAILHEEDPTRLVSYASNGKSPANLDFLSNNDYPFWYGKGLYTGGSGGMFKDHRYVSEFGAGGVPSSHIAYGAENRTVNKFEPEEYQQLLLERVMPALFGPGRDKVDLYTWWIYQEFGVNQFKGRNTKGMLTFAGFRKDIFYLYQSYLRPDHPVLHVCGKTHFLRTGDTARGVKIYGNARNVTLSLNGRAVGSQKNGVYTHKGGPLVDNVFFFDLPLAAGRNDLVATDDRGQTDRAVIYAAPLPDAPLPVEPAALVRDLKSSNPANPAYLLTDGPRAQEPVYGQVDGAADNTFDALPAALVGAQRIVTRRLSDPAQASELRFTVTPQARAVEVLVMTTSPSAAPLPGVYQNLSVTDPAFARGLTTAGFRDTGAEALWRDNSLRLVGARLWSHTAKASETLTLPAFAADYAVFIRPAPVRP